MIKNKKSNGFTLIELLISISVVGILIIGITDFYFTIVSSRIKNQTIADVEQQGTSASKLLTQLVRNATEITSPVVGASGTMLTLDSEDAALDPTIIDASLNRLRIREGAASPVFLTTTSVTLSDLTFTNLSRASTPGVVQISFTLTHINQPGTQGYDYVKTFTTSAALR